MSESQSDLKAEILAELRRDMSAPSRTTQYLNAGLLVAIGLVVGFLVGQRYDRVLRDVQPAARAAAAGRPGEAGAGSGQVALPPDHPPMEGVGGGDPMAAVTALRERIAADPNDVEALVALGNLNFDIGRMEASIDYYQRAIALDPTDANVITDLGVAYRNSGKVDEALQAFELAASMDTAHWQSRLNRAITLMVDKGDTGAALQAFEAYLALGPSVPNRVEVERQIEQLRRTQSGEARIHGPEDTTPADATATDT